MLTYSNYRGQVHYHVKLSDTKSKIMKINPSAHISIWDHVLCENTFLYENTFLCMRFTFRAIRNSLPSCFISTRALQATKFLSCSCVGLFVGLCVFACVRVRNRVVVFFENVAHEPHRRAWVSRVKRCKWERRAHTMFTPWSSVLSNLNVLFFYDGKRLPDFRRGIEPAPDHFQRHPPGVFCTHLHVD